MRTECWLKCVIRKLQKLTAADAVEVQNHVVRANLFDQRHTLVNLPTQYRWWAVHGAACRLAARRGCVDAVRTNTQILCHHMHCSGRLVRVATEPRCPEAALSRGSTMKIK